MSISYIGTSNVSSDKQKEFVVDYLADLAKLPTTTRGARYPLNTQFPKPVPMGSKVYVIATGETYILSSDVKSGGWVKYMAGKVLEEPAEDPSVPGGPVTPSGYTIYHGALPTNWNEEGDDTIDYVADDITLEMVTALDKIENQTSFARTIMSICSDDTSQWVYAYPKKFGEINSILSSGLENLSNFETKELDIDGETYIVYFTVGHAAGEFEYIIS